MTYLASRAVGQWLYLYLILDVYSRKIVGFEVHEADSSDHAIDLLRRTAPAGGIHALSEKPVLHGNHGATMKATTVVAMLHWLRIKPSYSRPRVSDDNAFVEALFRTAKYRPQYPSDVFADLNDARGWASQFVRWYNHEHRHGGIPYVSPAERHAGDDPSILARRHTLYIGDLAMRTPRHFKRPCRDFLSALRTLPHRRETLAVVADHRPICQHRCGAPSSAPCLGSTSFSRCLAMI